MAPFIRATAVAALLITTSACATLGTNVSGSFACLAGAETSKPGCEPTGTVDAAATKELAGEGPELATARQRAGVATGDLARTPERLLKIVFPAHVDERGTLHDEAAVWAVIDPPQWAGELRARPSDDTSPPLLRALRERLKTAQKSRGDDGVGNAAAPVATDSVDLILPFTPSVPADGDPALSIASPPVLPSTANGANAGAPTPAVEGLAMPPSPHARVPRPAGAPPDTVLVFPSAAAIEAARAKAAPTPENK
jgi:conjugal transfer pilus assembly protein TraV